MKQGCSKSKIARFNMGEELAQRNTECARARALNMLEAWVFEYP